MKRGAYRCCLLLAAALGWVVDSRALAQTPSPSGTVLTIAGNGSSGYSGDGGSALSATLNSPLSLTISPGGAIYFPDGGNYRIRGIDPATGLMTTVVGDGTAANVFGSNGDGGQATAAQIAGVSSVAVDAARGALYFADPTDNRVRKVDLATGIVTTYAGQGAAAFGLSGDGGAATAATFAGPLGVAVDGAGRLVIADGSNNRVRRVDPATNVVTSIGTVISPGAVSADGAGNVYVAATDGASIHRVYRIDATTGIITTVAGGGVTTPGVGPATGMQLALGTDVAVNSAGSAMYIADGNRVLAVDLTTGLLSPLAGTGTTGFAGDGGPAAAAADFGAIGGIGLSPAGELFISDTGNHRIRYVVPDAINLSGTAQTALRLPWINSLVGDLVVTDNPNLTVLDAPALSSVGGMVTVSGDGAVGSINLGSVTSVGGNIDVHGNTSAGTINLGALTTVAGNLDVHANGAAGSISLGALTDVGGNIDVSGNGSAVSITLASLANVGGNIHIAANASTGTSTFGSLASVGGNLTVESAGAGTFDVSGATVGGDTALTLTGYGTVSAATAGGQTRIIMRNIEATMEMVLPSGVFSSGLPVAFRASKLANGPSELVSGQTVTPLETYGFDFDTTTLDLPAELDFEINLSAMDVLGRASLLELLHSGVELTVAVRGDAPGSPLELFSVAGVGEDPILDTSVRVLWLDQDRMALTAGGGIDPTFLRFEGLVGHFSTYGIVAVGEVPEPCVAGLVMGLALARRRRRSIR